MIKALDLKQVKRRGLQGAHEHVTDHPALFEMLADSLAVPYV